MTFCSYLHQRQPISFENDLKAPNAYHNMSHEHDDEQEDQRWFAHPDGSTTHTDVPRTVYPAQIIYRSASSGAAVHNPQQGLQTWYRPDEVLHSPYVTTSVYPWPPSYITSSSPGADLATAVGYPSGPTTDGDSTSALEDMLLQQQVAHFQSPFDENFPLQSISGGIIPQTFRPDVRSTSLPQTASAISPALVLSSSAHASPSTVRGSPVPSATGAPPEGIAAAAPPSSRGKKRVRESTPPDMAYMTPARADAKRPKAVPRAKKTKTGSETSIGEPTRAPASSSNVDEPWTRKTATPTPPADGADAAARRTGRKGPLPQGTREKIEEVRSSGACWRCRRYKKPCNNRSGTCDTCLTSGFRIWPASLGCRRGDTQEFVDAILPTHMEEVLETLPPDLPRPHTWRPSLEPRIQGPPSSADGRAADKWDHLCEKILGTRLFGQEFVELFEIMAQYQRDAPKEDPIFNLVAATLSYNVDLYHQFINLGSTTIQPAAAAGNPHPASATVMSLRASLSNTLSTWLSLCLRGRMHDFPITFLSATLTLCGLLVFSDSVASLKQITGSLIWPVDARDQMIALRKELMTISIDLLGVVAKGAKPLRFRCWLREPSEGGGPAERSAEGMRLMGNSVPAFEAMAALQRWIRRWRGTLESDVWHESPPFTPGIRPIQALARFVRMGHGEFEDQ